MPKPLSGRPFEFCEELAERIINELTEGRTLKSICEPEDMPFPSTVYRWMWNNPRFENQYDRAREVCADIYVDEMLGIADDSTNDYMESNKGIQFNAENVQRSKLRVDTRRWIAGKLKPRRYGDALQVAGPNGRDLIPGGIVQVFALPSNGRDDSVKSLEDHSGIITKPPTDNDA
jgi:hypothetical protein